MVTFSLPWSLYIAFGLMSLAAIYNIASWNTVRYYLQCTYPEQAPRVMTLMAVNRLLMVGTMIFSAISVGTSGGVIEGIVTLIIATPITLFSVLFYMIFTMLHKEIAHREVRS
ncbi:MAG: hypothetical protein WC654_06910 [Patescibacteria group bacterium]